jgi:hypothetical protein
MAEAQEFLKVQNTMLENDVVRGGMAAILLERIEKVTLMNRVVDRGNEIFVVAERAQRERNPELLQQVLATFGEIQKDLDKLESTSDQDRNLERIGNIKKAAQEYKNAITALLEIWEELRREETALAQAGERMMAIARGAAQNGFEQMESLAVGASAAMRKIIFVMLLVTGVALILGILMAWYVSRQITKPLALAVSCANRVREGDFTILREDFGPLWPRWWPSSARPCKVSLKMRGKISGRRSLWRLFPRSPWHLWRRFGGISRRSPPFRNPTPPLWSRPTQGWRRFPQEPAPPLKPLPKGRRPR